MKTKKLKRILMAHDRRINRLTKIINSQRLLYSDKYKNLLTIIRSNDFLEELSRIGAHKVNEFNEKVYEKNLKNDIDLKKPFIYSPSYFIPLFRDALRKEPYEENGIIHFNLGWSKRIKGYLNEKNFGNEFLLYPDRALHPSGEVDYSRFETNIID